MDFAKRKAAFLKKAKTGRLRIDLAVDETSSCNVGFIVSCVNDEKVGEVESIFLDEGFRGYGIGDALMMRALAWMGAGCGEQDC